MVNGTCVGRPFKFGFHGKKDCFGFRMAMDYSSATFELGNWTVTVKGMPSCDTGQDCLIKGPAHRIDVGFTARGNTLRPATCHTVSSASPLPRPEGNATASKMCIPLRETIPPPPKLKAPSRAWHPTMKN